MRFVYCSVVAFAAVTRFALAANIGVLTNEIYNDSGAPGNYTNASSIAPNTTNDILLGLTAISTNYVGTYEAGGGTTAPFTDGLTATDGNSDLNQGTSNQNALFDLGGGPQPWYVEYQFLTTPANVGYGVDSVSVISGHQDSRVNQAYDILLSTDGTNFYSMSDGHDYTTLGQHGPGFSYAPSNGDGGAASSTLVPSDGDHELLTSARYLVFVDLSGGNAVYREITAQGTPEPSSIVLLGLGAIGLAALARRRSKALARPQS